MGLFGKKKNTETRSSVLTESEIRKKLYGEFSDSDSHVVIGDRDHLREPVTTSLPPLKEPFLEKGEKETDLFSAQEDILTGSDMPSRQTIPAPAPKITEPMRPVPPQAEKKPFVSAPASSPDDLYARFPYNRPPTSRWAVVQDFLMNLSEKAGDLVRFIRDPRQVVLRRFFYWGTAVLVIFLLFWGVNALNSQREEALRARYNISGGEPAAKAPEAVVVAPVKPVAERPVVVTPSPATAVKTTVESATVKPLASVPNAYVIQVVTYPSMQDAESIVKTLKGAGFNAFVKESVRPTGTVFYMVLIGGFRTASEAQAQLAKFRTQEVARPFQDAFVRTNRS
jgi:cell division septation protein DedD